MATFHHPHFFSSNDLLKPPLPLNLTTLPVKSKNAKKKEEEAWKEKKKVFVDYDGGSHSVSVQLSGIRKADLPLHKRVRVAGDRFQKDWSISEVVQRVLGTKHWEDIEGLLNRVELFSALSVLVHNNAEICLLVPDLVPSVLALLQTKAVEVIKAVLGFVKVLVLCHQAKDLQNILPDIVNEGVRWSSVSRHHFRAKVAVILEILMRRCGSAQVKLVTPEKHLNFVKGILENRHGKASSKESSATDMEPEVLKSNPRRMQRKRKSEESSIPSEEDGKVESRFRKRGMKLVKKAGSHTADRRTEGQSRGNARNKRNFNGDPTAS